MRRQRYKLAARASSSGDLVKVLDDDTIEGWPPGAVFMTCSARSDLWHVAARQGAGVLTIPSRALCGAKPYHGAECRQDWPEEVGQMVKVCKRCIDRGMTDGR